MIDDRDVVIVAARGAYEVYREYGIYACQVGRTFRDVERMGFYTGNQINPELPRILARRDALTFDRDTVWDLRGSSDPDDRAIADAVERMLRANAVRAGQVDQVFLLSSADDARTVRLPRPIVNTSTAPGGRRIAWTRGQRYASLSALTAAPETTADLALLEGREGEKTDESDWRSDLRRIHDDGLDVDWAAHLAALNASLGLSGRHELHTTDVGLPPSWFNGDVEAIEPGRWTLVVSLNPGKAPPGFYGDDLRRDNGWDFWRRHNAGRWWYGRFFRPLVRVASLALGDDLEPEDEPLYATERMVFVELCPYASGTFALGDDELAALSRTDPGFLTAARVRRMLIDEARPALLLVNGSAAVRDAEALDADRLRWDSVEYASVVEPRPGEPPKRLWHKQGIYDAPFGPLPAFGFPFLKKPATHNANREIDQLGMAIRSFLEASRAGRLPDSRGDSI